jgi:hypothetical protein
MALVLSLGAMALCTIVAIWYIWVRKIGTPEKPAN